MANPLAPIISRARRILGLTIPMAPLAFFFHALSIMLSAGRSIDEALGSLAAGYDPELEGICDSIRMQIRSGASLKSSLQVHKSRFPEIVPCVLEVGEISGGLTDSAQRLAEAFEQEVDAIRKFRKGAWDPTIVVIASTLIVFIGLVLQSLESLSLEGPVVPALIRMALKAFGAMLMIGGIWLIARVVFRIVFRWQPARIVVDTVKLSLPGLGTVFRNLSAARWVRSFATMWAAGVNISVALEVASRSALNAHYERALQRASFRTRRGESLAKSLTRDLLPAHLLTIITTCEMTGNMDTALVAIAKEMEREALARAIIEMNRLVMFGWVLLIIVAVLSAPAI